MSRSIHIRKDHFEEIIASAKSHAPIESCGIIAGKNGRSIKVFPITNILQSSTRYQMAPNEQIKVLLQLEENQWDLLAIYHSHPAGPPYPSVTDIAEATYPEAVYLIVSSESGNWICKGFIIDRNEINEVEVST